MMDKMYPADNSRWKGPPMQAAENARKHREEAQRAAARPALEKAILEVRIAKLEKENEERGAALMGLVSLVEDMHTHMIDVMDDVEEGERYDEVERAKALLAKAPGSNGEEV